MAAKPKELSTTFEPERVRTELARLRAQIKQNSEHGIFHTCTCRSCLDIMPHSIDPRLDSFKGRLFRQLQYIRGTIANRMLGQEPD